VLILAVVQGLPYAEIALICGCEVGTVKSRANRARAALKHLLLDDEASAASPRSVESEPAGGRARQPGRKLVVDPFGGSAEARSSVGVNARREA
jgi:RNA polymerase sigma-70 factor (ECF subfamily)